MRTLAFVFESAEAARAVALRLAAARLIARDFEIDSDLTRYGVVSARGLEPSVLRVRLEPGQSEQIASELFADGGGRPIPLPAEDHQRLSLEDERLRTERLWRAILGEHVPMSVAAATTFHRVHGTTKTIVTRKDYDDALNIAASALSTLVPVYTLDRQRSRRELTINLVTQRFALGATQLRSTDGNVVDELSVQRSDLLFALSIIRRAGLPFSFALLAPERRGEAPAARRGEEKKTQKNEKA